MEALDRKNDEAKEKNMARTDKSAYFVVRGLPSKWEIKSIQRGQMDKEVFDYLGTKADSDIIVLL